MNHIRTTFICNDGEYFLRHRRPVADALTRAGHVVTVLAGGLPLPGDRIGDWRYVNVQIERLAFHPVSDLALFLSSLREIAAGRPRQIQLVTLKPAIISGLAALAARFAGRGPERIVVTIPGLGRLMSPGSALTGARAGMARYLVGRVIRVLSRRPGVYFTFETTDDRRHWLALGYIREETSLVVNGAGVDPTCFHPSDRAAARPRMRVLFASRLLRAKGLDAFVEAARRLGGAADIEFLVAGKAEPQDPDGYPCEELEREPSISFLGDVVGMPELLRSVDLVCLPTRYGEGIPRILIEAAATGLPCIASDVNGCTYIVKDGVSGAIVPVEPAEEMADRLAAAIERYRVDPEMRRRHGAASHAVFSEGGFAEDAVTRRIVALLTGPGPR